MVIYYSQHGRTDVQACGSVGIGRRARLRILWQQCRVGSSPIFRIELLENHCIYWIFGNYDDFFICWICSSDVQDSWAFFAWSCETEVWAWATKFVWPNNKICLLKRPWNYISERPRYEIFQKILCAPINVILISSSGVSIKKLPYRMSPRNVLTVSSYIWEAQVRPMKLLLIHTWEPWEPFYISVWTAVIWNNIK